MAHPPNSPSQLLEVIHSDAPRGRFRFALLDFDGTLSLVREGWKDVMTSYFVEELLKAPRHETAVREGEITREFVEALNGKQTIVQCERLAEEIARRGGTPLEPEAYKREYLARLARRTGARTDALRSGAVATDSLLVRGARAFLAALAERGVALALASGTDLAAVRGEADLLGIEDCFEGRIYGPCPEEPGFTKQAVIERALREHGLRGEEMLVVGDGDVEIANAKAVGAYAVGVASDEAHPGCLDEGKRQRLIEAGADLIIRDYASLDAILSCLFPEPARG